MMKIEVLMSKLFGFSNQTYFNWKKDENKRPIIKLLSKYFKKEELEEFLETGKIQKIDNLLKIQDKVIKANSKKYLSTFVSNLDLNSLFYTDPLFQDFYFNFLLDFEFKDKKKKFSSILNSYLIFYILVQKDKNPKELEKIGNYLYMFQNWDELMSIFLSINIETYFSDLFTDVTELNELKRKEAYYHIIGLYVYQNHSELSPFFKIEVLVKIFNKISHKIFTHFELMEFLKENTVKAIEELKKPGLDKYYL